MPRRTLARRNATLLTLAQEPWTLFETDPGAGGGGGGGNTPSINEHGYPDSTPVADMTPEHQAAYWKYHARKHEAAAKSVPDGPELERLRQADEELKKRLAADLSETERLQKERDEAAAEVVRAKAAAEEATRKALVLEVAAEKGLTPAQAARLQGSTKEELEADADSLKALFGSTGGQGNGGSGSRSGGNRGSDVGATKSVSAGAERYAQKHGKQQ
ncbi:capsid assembly scaffolding protein Gp46 family protein [Streptomyces longwoodensis]|uniref:capsid assembly scaffolding protein Gp46 family protein n=1 Tax=Streptomyces longwoodensis TaxID=68231 RepID=UPI0033D1C472